MPLSSIKCDGISAATDALQNAMAQSTAHNSVAHVLPGMKVWSDEYVVLDRLDILHDIEDKWKYILAKELEEHTITRKVYD